MDNTRVGVSDHSLIRIRNTSDAGYEYVGVRKWNVKSRNIWKGVFSLRHLRVPIWTGNLPRSLRLHTMICGCMRVINRVNQ